MTKRIYNLINNNLTKTKIKTLCKYKRQFPNYKTNKKVNIKTNFKGTIMNKLVISQKAKKTKNKEIKMKEIPSIKKPKIKTFSNSKSKMCCLLEYLKFLCFIPKISPVIISKKNRIWYKLNTWIKKRKKDKKCLKNKR